ncbi:cyclic nucleotide-binding domain-containing protein [Shimia sp.]|uniref:Crp/Fnr family transcriptional regulator n=1 Tax=Shimia sp. TaxID=1954381 RepID=UPI003298E9EB
MSQTLIFEIAGLIGVGFYLGSYALLQAGVLKGNGYAYAGLNLAAASLVLVSLFNGWNLWSAIIQASWITISIIGMTRVWLLTQGLRFSPEEEELRQRHFAHMRRLDVKRLFRAGDWREGQPGDPLTEENRPVAQLSYVAKGGVDIVVAGNVIAAVGAGEFIGEMAVLARGPASATVAINQPSRYFAITSEALQKLIRHNGEIAAHLEAAFSHSVRAKLIATNARLEQALHGNAAE